jgi:hypothetical protein
MCGSQINLLTSPFLVHDDVSEQCATISFSVATQAEYSSEILVSYLHTEIVTGLKQ